jgi:chromosome segregation ATPase
MPSSQSKLDALQKKYQVLLHDMKKLERSHTKDKKRADQLQKEKDSTTKDLTKVTTMKDKLEKLSRDVTRDNKKLKVCSSAISQHHHDANPFINRKILNV